MKKTNVIFLLSDIFMYFCFFTTFIVTNIENNYIITRMRLIVTIVAGIFGLLAYIYKQKKIKIALFTFILITILSWVLIAAFRPEGMLSSNRFLYSLCYMGIALNLLSHRQKIIPAEILYYGVLIFMLYRLCVQGIAIRGFLLDGTSYNYISVLALTFLMLYCVILLQNNKDIPLISAILYFSVCIFSYGRAGCISGILFLGGVIFLNFGKIQNKLLKVIIIIIFMLLLTVFFQTNLFYDFASTFLGKFQLAGYVDESRLIIWHQFINNNLNSLLEFLLGSNPSLVITDMNMHNTFLQCWAHFGFLVFVIAVYSYIFEVINGFFSHKNAYVLILLIFAIRACTDRLAFWGYSEPFFYYFIFRRMLEIKFNVVFAIGRDNDLSGSSFLSDKKVAQD